MQFNESKHGTLTSCSDEDVAPEAVGHSVTGTDGEHLARGSRLAVFEGVLEQLGIKLAGSQKLDVEADAGCHRDVAGGVFGRQGRHLLYGLEIAAEGEAAEEVWVLAVAGQDGGIAEVGVGVDEVVGHGRAEGVADVDELAELGADARYCAVAEELGELREGGNLEVLLDFVDGVALGGRGNAETVPCEGREAILVGSLGHVAVIVVIVGEVPVAAVEANAVGQDVEGISRAVVWLAVGGADAVVAVDSFILERES